jgi:hypothetical protein
MLIYYKHALSGVEGSINRGLTRIKQNRLKLRKSVSVIFFDIKISLFGPDVYRYSLK